MPTKTEEFAAQIREQQAEHPRIAEVIPYLVACEKIRALTYGTDSVSSADVAAILDAVDLVEGVGR